MSKPGNGVHDEVVSLPVLSVDDVVSLGVTVTEGGERLVTFQIARLKIGFAMSLADTANAANALAHAANRVLQLNQEDAEKAGSSIVIARH